MTNPLLKMAPGQWVRVGMDMGIINGELLLVVGGSEFKCVMLSDSDCDASLWYRRKIMIRMFERE